ncbi:MAG: S8 family peptidase [Eubacteriales bacterium]|nr:S8 family peptidase [Eubacteriales bacterium]
MLEPEDYEVSSFPYAQERDIQIQQNEGDEEGMPLTPAQNEQYLSFIVKYSQNIPGSIEDTSDGTLQIINDIFAIVYFPLEQFSMLQINSYTYNAIPKCYTYMDVESLNASGITRLHNHPYLKLRGRGTMVAVIDSGIDYQNPVFRDGNGSKILAMWDQTIPGGPSELAPFGRVFFKEEIDAALASENPLEIVPSTDENGHGTMMAGVAAGREIPEENFSGAAPDASLIIVKLKPAKTYLKEFYLLPPDAEVFQEDDIMLAVAFTLRCARRFQKPMSICLGLGSSQGAHQGAGPLSQYVDSVANFAHESVSAAAGNEGAARHHYQGSLEQQRPVDTAELRVGEDNRGFTMEFWGDPPETFQISIQSPTGESLAVSSALRGGTQELSFVFVETRVLVNYIPIERQTGKTLVYFRFLHPAAGIWKFLVQGRNNRGSSFHMWLPVQGLVAGDTYFLQSSPYFTITSPGDAKDIMTTTAYQYRDNSLYLQASRGYATNGTVKPNFAAPGVEIKIPLLNGSFGYASGTSLAAAQNAGTSSLLFEWAIIRENEPFFTGISVKNYLQIGARREENMQYPNPDWGYGRVDLYHTFELLT